VTRTTHKSLILCKSHAGFLAQVVQVSLHCLSGKNFNLQFQRFVVLRRHKDLIDILGYKFTYGIDDGYSDDFYVVTISGTLKGGLAPYQNGIQSGQAVWLDVEITYHYSVYSCKVNNQSAVTGQGLSVTNYMIDCYREHLHDIAQAEANIAYPLKTDRRSI